MMNNIILLTKYSLKYRQILTKTKVFKVIKNVNLHNKLDYQFSKIIKNTNNNEIIDLDKVINALQENLITINDPNSALQDVNRLINLKKQKHNGEELYINYESDLFTKANVYYSLKDFSQCNHIIESIIKSKTASKEILTRTLILKASLIQHSQNDYTESLKIAKQAEEIIQDVNNATGKELQIIIYHMIGEIHSSIFMNRKEGKQYLEKAIKLINDEIDNNYLLTDKEKGQYMQRLANCYDSIAEICHHENKYDECKQIMSKCIELWKSNSFKQPFQYANSLIKQGKISCDREEYLQAIEKFNRAKKLMQGYENTDQFIVLCLQISRSNRGLQKFQNSLEIMNEAKSQLPLLNDTQRLYYQALVQEELIEILLNQGKIDESIEQIKIFLQFPLSENDTLRYRVLKQEIVILLIQEKYQELIEASNKLLKICQQIYGENSKEQSELLATNGISQIYMKNFDEGFTQIKQSTDILQKLGHIDEVQEIWNQVVQILEQQQNYQQVIQALGHLKRSIQIFAEKEKGQAELVIDFIDQQIQQAKLNLQKHQ